MRTVNRAVCLIVLASAPALAQEAPAQEQVTILPAPPDGFDALHASDFARAYYGFPARPAQTGANGAAAYAVWAKAMSSALHYVVPEIRVMAQLHGPERPATRGFSAAAQGVRATTQQASFNWAGQTLRNGAGSFGTGAFKQVIGLWLLPSVQQAIGTCAGMDVSAIWVGIDGANDASSDVVQAGTESDPSCANGITTTKNYPWFEWYPAYSYQITNFALSAGDSVFVTIQATSATSAQAMFVNLKNGNYTTAPITAPGTTRLIGNTAEWVIERPTLASNQYGTLADFGVAMMCYELAQSVNVTGSVSPGAPGPGQTPYMLTMINSNEVTIAETAAMGPNGQAFSVQGPTK